MSVNSLVVETPREKQIMLKVQFAEVDRTKLEQFGINILSTGAANTPGTTTTGQLRAASDQREPHQCHRGQRSGLHVEPLGF